MFKKCIIAIFVMVLCIGFDAGAQVMTPAPNVHPRVLLTQEHINHINATSVKYAADLKSVRTYAGYELPAQDGILDFITSMQLECRAFMYQMGELSQEKAKETVAYAIEYLENPKTDETSSISIYKDFGQFGIQTGSLVYDWMYDVMNDTEKSELAAKIRNLIYSDAQPCTPDNVAQWNDIAGGSVGLPIVYNSMAAIALYDVYPEIYNSIMPKIQGTMAEAVKRFGEKGALSDGSIAYIREHYTYYVATMFKRLGFNISTLYGDQTPIGYKLIYSRLPWGGLLKQGDDFVQTNYQFGSHVKGGETSALGLLATLNNNDYFAFQYNGNNNTTGLEKLLYFVNDLTPKMPDDLPLAYYVDEPRSEIIARTSWQYGKNSPAVVAYMNMNNRRSCDHDHANAGNFQIYYKGALTAPRGKYEGTGWGKDHWLNYYSRSIASNCMLIYDENENYFFPNKTPSNDGGQQMASRNGAYVISSLDDFFADFNQKVVTESHFIGPEANTPAFSYIKGDLTNAYSDKVETYKRSMVFMDLFDEDIPAAMIVYDKVKSSNANFKKTWVLNSFTKPIVNNNQQGYPITSFLTSEEGSNGKLENTTLLPVAPTILTVGGDGHDYEVNGTQYEADDKIDVLYDNGWRTEISPSVADTDDTFLNVIFVSDSDETKKPNITYVDGILFHGVSIQDRAVYMSKNADNVANAFSLEVPSSCSGNTRVLVTDIASGYWQVSGGGKVFNVHVSEDSNSLSFNGSNDEYIFTPVSNVAVTPMTFADKEKESIGDFAIRLDGTYIYVPEETMNKNGVPYVSAYDIFPELGFTASVNGGKTTVTKNGKNTIFDEADFTHYIFNGTKFGLKNNLIKENGKIYVPLTELEAVLSSYVKYDTYSAVVDIISYSQDYASAGGIIPNEISSVKVEKLPMLIDGNTTESVVVYGTNEIIFDLGALYKVDGIEYFANQADFDGFSIQGAVNQNEYFDTELTRENISKNKYLVSWTATPLRYIKLTALRHISLNEISVKGDNTPIEILFMDSFKSNYPKSKPLDLKFYAGNDDIEILIDDKLINPDIEQSGNIFEASVNISQLIVGAHKITVKTEKSSVDKTFYTANDFDERKLVNYNFNSDSTGNFSVVVNDGTKGYITNKSNGTSAYGINVNKNSDNASNFLNFSGFKNAYGVYKIEADVLISAAGSKLSAELRDYFGSTPSGGATLLVCDNNGLMCDGKTSYPIDQWFKIGVEIDTVNALVSFYLEDTFLCSRPFLCDGLSTVRFVCATGENDTSFCFDNISVVYSKYKMVDFGLKTQSVINENKLSVTIDGNASPVGRMKIIKAIKRENTLCYVSKQMLELDWRRRATVDITLPNDYDTENYVYELYMVHLDNEFDIFRVFKETNIK